MPQTKQYAYKVFYRNGRKLRSAGRIPLSLKMEYPVGQWVKPEIKGSKLFCFKKLPAYPYELKAHFLHKFQTPNNLEVWKIQVDSLKRVRQLPNVWTYTTDKDYGFHKPDKDSFDTFKAEGTPSIYQNFMTILNYWTKKKRLSQASDGYHVGLHLCETIGGCYGANKIKLIEKVA